MPLSEERLTALRQSIKIHRDQLDNNFLVREKMSPGRSSVLPRSSMFLRIVFEKSGVCASSCLMCLPCPGKCFLSPDALYCSTVAVPGGGANDCRNLVPGTVARFCVLAKHASFRQ